MSDLIDREVLMDALDKHCDIVCPYSKKQRNVMCGACALGTAFDVIEALPSAQPERPKEHWMLWGKYTDVYPDDIPVYRCSECFCQSTKRSKFCPNCGAKMEVEHE